MYVMYLYYVGIIVSLVLATLIDAWSIPFQNKYDYDFVVIGGGASGMFAAGMSSSVGYKTLLIDKAQASNNGNGNASSDGASIEFTLGGDCTNAACVPSKSVRSVAKIASMSSDCNEIDWLHLARHQANYAVGKVRAREDPSRIGDVPNLDLEFVKDCQFISPHEIQLICYDNSTWSMGKTVVSPDDVSTQKRTIRSKKYLIAVGASPVVPDNLARAAREAEVPYLTYRTLLRPNSNTTLLSETYNNIVIIGGGATACELGQSLSKLRRDNMNISIVAPTLLPTEDAPLQNSVINILSNDGCNLILETRAVDVKRYGPGEGARIILSNEESIPVDCIIFCTGRSPNSSLQSLQLDKAGIHWTSEKGVTTNSYLRSTSAKHVYACGDCASTVEPRDRRAIHAGWMGFSAARNALLPWFLRSRATHPFVPRVVYTDPEISSAGISTAECIEKYGTDGYESLFVREDGSSDRADMESIERSTSSNFIELRAEKVSGRILGVSSCGPSSAEICNEVCLALVNRMTVRDMARTLHSYPSHGYMLYRIAMGMATKNISGLLSGCSQCGRFIGLLLRILSRIATFFELKWLPWSKRRMKKLFRWQAEGARHTLLSREVEGDKISTISFLDAYNSKTLCELLLDDNGNTTSIRKREFAEWVSSKD